MLAATMCSSLLTGSAAAADIRPPRHPSADEIEQRALRQAGATRRPAPLPEPSGVQSSGDRDAMIWPVEGRVTSTYGPRYGRMHRGIDVAAPVGTPIRAVRGGTVAFSGWKGGYGNTVDIAHDGGGTTRSAHQSELLVHEGEQVERGQVIGRVGTTGSSTGPHLHFEVSVGGTTVDPGGLLPADTG